MESEPEPSRAQRAIAAAIEKRHAVTKCPVCGDAQWNLPQGIVLLRLQADLMAVPWSPLSKGETTMLPCAPLVCKSCGNTLLINLVMLGVDLSDLTHPEGSK
jgi:hypothetical protein